MEVNYLLLSIAAAVVYAMYKATKRKPAPPAGSAGIVVDQVRLSEERARRHAERLREAEKHYYREIERIEALPVNGAADELAKQELLRKAGEQFTRCFR